MPYFHLTRSTEKFEKKMIGENEIKAVLQRLDRLTLDEARATGVQTLEVVYGLVQNRRAIMDGENTVVVCPSFAPEDA
jgi:hypothetical protein